MKKIRLCFISALAFAGLTANAQTDDTLRFIDSQGNAVESGSTITVTELTDDGYQDPYIDSGLSVVNTTDGEVGAGLELTISEINGSLTCCFPGNCSAQTSVIEDHDNGTDIMSANETRIFHTNYTPFAYSTCVATFRLKVYDVTYTDDKYQLPVYTFKSWGPQVTVNFIYADETSGIVNAETEAGNEVTGYYTLQGKKIPSLQKGVNLVRYADGHTVKTAVK